MPLHNCPACGFEISEDEQVCPNCGYSLIDPNSMQFPYDMPNNAETPENTGVSDVLDVGENTEGEDDESNSSDEEDDTSSQSDDFDEDALKKGCLISVGAVCLLILFVMIVVTLNLGPACR